MSDPLQPLIDLAKRPGVKLYFAAQTVVEAPGKRTSRKSVVFGKCVACGCTDFDCSQCVARTGQPCSWLDDTHTRCSACPA